MCVREIYWFVLCGDRLLTNPSDYMQPLCDAVTELARQVDHKYLKEGEQVLVGFDGPFVSRRVTPRDLLSSFIGSMVCVEGIVTKCKLVFRCACVWLLAIVKIAGFSLVSLI